MNNVDFENLLPTASGTEPEPDWLTFEPPDEPAIAENQNWFEDALPLICLYIHLSQDPVAGERAV